MVTLLIYKQTKNKPLGIRVDYYIKIYPYEQLVFYESLSKKSV